MTGEEIKALAKAAYCDDAEFESVWSDGDFRTFCAALLHEAMRTRPEDMRSDVLEEAADLCDQHLDQFSGTECTYRCDVAQAIRALKRTQSPQALTPPNKERDSNFWPNGVWKCGALNCEPPCRCSPPIPPNHRPMP